MSTHDIASNLPQGIAMNLPQIIVWNAPHGMDRNSPLHNIVRNRPTRHCEERSDVAIHSPVTPDPPHCHNNTALTATSLQGLKGSLKSDCR